MATVTPASIAYTVDGVDVVIDAHAILVEGHQASATITKYPVQTGLHISNHSIRHNREVELVGMISNIRIDDRMANFGSDAAGAVLNALTLLIQNGTECVVTTNLTVYDPIVFKKVKTKQKAGLVDSMQFTLFGEEIVKVGDTGQTLPSPVSFFEITGAEREVLVAELADSGVYALDTDIISTGSYVDGESFSLTNSDAFGDAVTTSYDALGIDPTTGGTLYGINLDESALDITDASESSFLVNVSTAVKTAASVVETGKTVMATAIGVREGAINSVSGILNAGLELLPGGVQQIGDCMLEEIGAGVDNIVEDTINTALGELRSSALGAFYDVTDMGGIGGAILTAGVGCVVRSGSQYLEDTLDPPSVDDLPTFDDIVNAADTGFGVTESTPQARTTLIMVECCQEEPLRIDTDISMIPIP